MGIPLCQFMEHPHSFRNLSFIMLFYLAFSLHGALIRSIRRNNKGCLFEFDSLNINILVRKIVHVNRLNKIFSSSPWTVNESPKGTKDDFRVCMSSFPQILHQNPYVQDLFLLFQGSRRLYILATLKQKISPGSYFYLQHLSCSIENHNFTCRLCICYSFVYYTDVRGLWHDQTYL